jgi:hypothetical protein
MHGASIARPVAQDEPMLSGSGAKKSQENQMKSTIIATSLFCAASHALAALVNK